MTINSSLITKSYTCECIEFLEGIFSWSVDCNSMFVLSSSHKKDGLTDHLVRECVPSYLKQQTNFDLYRIMAM
jgi:hypothetical protein